MLLGLLLAGFPENGCSNVTLNVTVSRTVEA